MSCWKNSSNLHENSGNLNIFRSTHILLPSFDFTAVAFRIQYLLNGNYSETLSYFKIVTGGGKTILALEMHQNKNYEKNLILFILINSQPHKSSYSAIHLKKRKIHLCSSENLSGRGSKVIYRSNLCYLKTNIYLLGVSYMGSSSSRTPEMSRKITYDSCLKFQFYLRHFQHL